jgi:hypothetical protein
MTMPFRLKLRATELDLPQGELMIGRAPECFLRIDDELVSRRHARLVVSPDGVVLEDLGSRNGSRVNGRAVEGNVALAVGDEVEIGSETFRLLDTAGAPRPTQTIPPVRACGVCHAVMEAQSRLCPKCGADQSGEDTAARSMTSFELVLGVGDKMLQLGRLDEAERILGPRLRELYDRASRGDTTGAEEVAGALRRAMRLAAGTRRAEWYAWIFDLARATRRPLDDALLDDLHAHMMVHKPAAAPSLRAYLETQGADDAETQQRRKRLEALLRYCR